MKETEQKHRNEWFSDWEAPTDSEMNVIKEFSDFKERYVGEIPPELPIEIPVSRNRCFEDELYC